ncbi:hypothetical protein SAMN05421882_105910 [Nitrosomonas communis]|uniref:Uncharacterized protein n=1 Tax=Nitrosomonas communis TaxID=44574 RepID=A0A1H2YVG6_9PROT|nr:hypothetical protein SAMN05421882_105910 [Nitrosomonas communis]
MSIKTYVASCNLFVSGNYPCCQFLRSKYFHLLYRDNQFNEITWLRQFRQYAFTSFLIQMTGLEYALSPVLLTPY